jgi:hypothetical protein
VELSTGSVEKNERMGLERRNVIQDKKNEIIEWGMKKLIKCHRRLVAYPWDKRSTLV